MDQNGQKWTKYTELDQSGPKQMEVNQNNLKCIELDQMSNCN